MPELERRPDPRWKGADEGLEARDVGLERRRELEQDGPQLGPGDREHVPHGHDRLLTVPQPTDVGEVAIRLEREHEVLRDCGRPTPDVIRARQPVEGRVHLDRPEPAGVVGEPLRGRQPRGIEAHPPVPVLPTACPHVGPDVAHRCTDLTPGYGRSDPYRFADGGPDGEGPPRCHPGLGRSWLDPAPPSSDPPRRAPGRALAAGRRSAPPWIAHP
jgi:hypothetical protein